MIFQVTFTYENDKLKNTKVNIITCSLSSVQEKNDYQPIILEGEEKERVLNNSSTNFTY